MVSALTDAVTDECGGEAALTGSAYLILAVALHRLGQRARGEGMEAEAGGGGWVGGWAHGLMVECVNWCRC